MRAAYLEHAFPDLQAWGYEVTSEINAEYNCIAWAMQDDTRNWWPSEEGTGYWPPGAPREETVEAFVTTFQSLGFVVCDDDAYEPEYEKLALFADEEDEPTHMARQFDADRWASKMGKDYDILHPLKAVEGSEYGRVVRYLKKRRSTGGGDAPAAEGFEDT
jgi:hypothetical protein